MNCRQGDIARFVGGSGGDGLPTNLGRIVICVRLVPKASFHTGFVADAWVVDPPLRTSYGPGITKHCPDAWLRPIRPSDAPDETLSYVGKPEGVPA